MEHTPAIWVQVVGGVWIALIGYHAFLWTLRRHFASETRNAMRWLALSTMIGGVMFFWVYQVTG